MWTRHIEGGRKAGCTDSQINALLNDDLNGSMWSEAESSMLVFLSEVIKHPDVSETTFEDLKRHFNEREIIEILTMQASILSRC